MGLMGKAYDRYGLRKMASIIVLLFGLACFYMSTISSVTMLLAGFFIIRLFGQGSMGLISSTLVPQWFIRRKGRALSIVSIFSALSMACYPPLNTWIIGSFGWRNAWRIWTIVLCLLIAPIFYLFIRTRPEDVGLQPDNVKLSETGTDHNDYVEEVSWTLREAIRTPSFWMINYITIIPSAIITGCVFHQISILGQAGLSPETAALISSLTSIVNLPIALIAGQGADRYPIRYMLALGQGLLLAMVVALYFAESMPLVILYGVLMGCQMGVAALVRGVVWPDYYGRQHLGTLRGVNVMAGVIGSSLGPLPFGYAFDVFGGYREALLVSMLFPLVGMLLGLLSKKPVRGQL